MGAWGTGPFDNDAAADFAYEIEESRGYRVIEDKLDEVIESSAEDSGVGSEGVAAAAVLAALLTRDFSGLSEELTAWAAAQKAPPPPAFLEKAARALDIILDDEESELRALWEEVEEENENWRQSIESLQKILRP